MASIARAPKTPTTLAVRCLRDAGVPFTPHLYDYVERGGAAASAQALGVDLHHMIKTLVMEDEQEQPMLVLMHGDLEVSTSALAREIGVRRVQPCAPERAQRLTGYMVGGTSPFGTRRELPVYAEQSIRALAEIYINGGRRGFLVQIASEVLDALLQVRWVSCAQ